MKNFIISGVIALAVVGAAAYFFITTRTEAPVATPDVPALDTSMSFFITSANPGKGGDLGGVKGADAYCTQLAEVAGVTGKTWRAYLSSNATADNPVVNARDRIGNGPWYNAKGDLVAENIFRLHEENNLNKTTALTETGGTVSGRGDAVNMHDILTGSTAEGTLAVDAGKDTTCANWTSADEGSTIVGHHDRIGINETAPMKSWNASHATRGCSMEDLKGTGGGGLFYCFAE